MTLRPATPLLLASVLVLALFAGCQAKDSPPLAAASQPAEIQGWETGLAATGAELAVEGGRTFAGPVSFRCVLHDTGGLQVNFRTGDPALPAVAVRIDEYRDGGPYPGHLFLTARSDTGALVTSQGDAQLRIAQQAPAPGAETMLQVSGSFKGTYRGAAGSGSINGRFGDCFYSRVRGAPGALGPGALPQPTPAAGEGIGDDVSMP
ncbi:MAG: hypothetical protein QOF89_2937 [Acidobacteriota bacterium]|jgi:hypothetical protein|nr:hypothetical protein [Acidobacteriota bacterium]